MTGGLCLTGTETVLSSAELRERLAVGPIWVWAEEGAARSTVIERYDGLFVTAGPGGPLAIEDQHGQAVVVSGARGFAHVTRLWRQHREYDLTKIVWRTLAAQPIAWRAADPLVRLRARTKDVFAQWKVRSVVDQAGVFATPTVLEAYTRHVGLGLSDTEQEIAAKHLRAGDRLLDVGCGTGREAFGFAARGMVVTAIDVCEPELRVARDEAARRGAEVTFRHGSIEDIALPPASFDVVFLSSDLYAAIPGRERRVAALRRCAGLVQRGGRVIVPANVAGKISLGGRVLLDAPRKLVRDLARRAGVAEDVVPEPGDRWVRDGGPGSPLVYAFHHRFADDAEIEGELADAGLTKIDHVSSYWITRAGTRRYRHRADVVAKPHEGTTVLVQLGDGAVFSLNGTGGTIFTLAGQGLDVEQIAERLHRETGVPLGDSRRDTTALLDELSARGLIDAEAA